jgi:nickel transport protein
MGGKMKAGNKNVVRSFFVTLLLLLINSWAEAHSIHYQVENKGISARIFYSPDEPASYSGYEIFGPGDKISHQKGRTDKNGFVSFLPDRPGTWIIKVFGESDHGYHGVQIEVKVNEGMFMESFKKPLIATHTKVIVGIGLMGWVFGAIALFKRNRKNAG